MATQSESPRWQRPKDVLRNYPIIGQTKLWQMARDNDGLFRKVGRATIVDTALLDSILENAPAAKLISVKD